jgi:hypothetical protein
VRGTRGELPAEWFIPDHFIRGWDDGRGPRIAKALERVGILARVDHGELERGYRFVWIRECNTPETVRKLRKRWRDEKSGGKET